MKPDPIDSKRHGQCPGALSLHCNVLWDGLPGTWLSGDNHLNVIEPGWHATSKRYARRSAGRPCPADHPATFARLGTLYAGVL